MKPMTLNNYGDQERLVEACQKVDIQQVLEGYRASIKEDFRKSIFKVNEIVISLVESRTGNGGVRFWLQCPACMRRIGMLYQSPSGAVGCRRCLKLDYRSHRYKGMVESGLGSAIK